jgi:hypothetical protein
MRPISPLERVLADACFGEEAGAEMAAGLRAFVEARGVGVDDAEAIAAAPARLAVYRTLVQNGIKTVIGRVLPRTRARLNAASQGRFDADLARFLDAVGPRTHYLRDVPGELVAWALPHWETDASVPADVPDLARFEIAAFDSASAPDDAVASPAPVALDRPLRFARSAQLLAVAWRVHEPGNDPTAAPPEGRGNLLAYRDADHSVGWLELTPLAASIAAELQAARPLGEAVTRACAAHSTTPAAVATEIAQLLADLAAHRVILGPS